MAKAKKTKSPTQPAEFSAGDYAQLIDEL